MQATMTQIARTYSPGLLVPWLNISNIIVFLSEDKGKGGGGDGSMET